MHQLKCTPDRLWNPVLGHGAVDVLELGIWEPPLFKDVGERPVASNAMPSSRELTSAESESGRTPHREVADWQDGLIQKGGGASHQCPRADFSAGWGSYVRHDVEALRHLADLAENKGGCSWRVVLRVPQATPDIVLGQVERHCLWDSTPRFEDVVGKTIRIPIIAMRAFKPR